MPTIQQLVKNDDGSLPAYAWPGGYQIYYLAADGGEICPDCANGKNGSECQNPKCQDDKQWQLIAFDIHYEGEPIECDHCGKQIESAYGPVE